MSKRSTLLFQKERGHRVRIVMRHRSTLFVFTVEDGGGGSQSDGEKGGGRYRHGTRRARGSQVWRQAVGSTRMVVAQSWREQRIWPVGPDLQQEQAG
jgi:hypothetical protein